MRPVRTGTCGVEVRIEIEEFDGLVVRFPGRTVAAVPITLRPQATALGLFPYGPRSMANSAIWASGLNFLSLRGSASELEAVRRRVAQWVVTGRTQGAVAIDGVQ